LTTVLAGNIAITGTNPSLLRFPVNMNAPPVIGPLASDELRDLEYAKTLLENPGLTARLANLLGSPLERGFAMLPERWSETVGKATRSALIRALELAIATMGKRSARKSSEFFHKVLVGASGGLGGAFGLAALPIELPISTGIMLRSIADIARSEGHDLRVTETNLACLEVFALGGRSSDDDAAENSYWPIRIALAKTISEAAAFIVERRVIEEGAPIIVRFIGAIASRFGIIVSEQVAAKAIPVVGAASGSIVNVLFIDHFQDMARGHFIVKRLEAKYGTECVRRLYEGLAE
jgi:EcsC family protein